MPPDSTAGLSIVDVLGVKLKKSNWTASSRDMPRSLYARRRHEDPIAIHITGGWGNAWRDSISRRIRAAVVFWRENIRGRARLQNEGHGGAWVVYVHVSQLHISLVKCKILLQ